MDNNILIKHAIEDTINTKTKILKDEEILKLIGNISSEMIRAMLGINL